MEKTAEQKIQEAKALIAETRRKTQEQKESYIELRDQTIKDIIPKIKSFSHDMQGFKKHIYNELQELLNSRAELYKNTGRKVDTHKQTFTTSDKQYSITI